MSRLADFRSGGAVHIVVNNQIGFTAEAQAARSTRYATDLFKVIEKKEGRLKSLSCVAAPGFRSAHLACLFSRGCDAGRSSRSSLSRQVWRRRCN